MELVNQVRGYHFLLGVLRSQQNDPFCGVCSAYANTVRAAREQVGRLATEHDAALSEMAAPFASMLDEARAGLDALAGPEAPSGQKKAGNCKLPQGICFVKASFALVQTI